MLLSLQARSPDPWQDSLGPLENLGVGESHDSKAEFLEVLLAASIALRLARLVVRRPVDFNDQAGLRAIEIHNEGADPVLPSESMSANLAAPNVCPEPLLRGRRVVAELASDFLVSSGVEEFGQCSRSLPRPALPGHLPLRRGGRARRPGRGLGGATKVIVLSCAVTGPLRRSRAASPS